MDHSQAQQTMSGLDVAAYIVSFGSLVGSVIIATLLVPHVGSGLYGGTAVLVFIILFLQVVGFVLAVGVPAMVQAIRRRFRMSRRALVVLAIALAGVAAEGVALTVIRVTGNC